MIAQYKATFKWIYVTFIPIAYLYSPRRIFAIASTEFSYVRVFLKYKKKREWNSEQWTLISKNIQNSVSSNDFGCIHAYNTLFKIRCYIFWMHAVILCFYTPQSTHTNSNEFICIISLSKPFRMNLKKFWLISILFCLMYYIFRNSNKIRNCYLRFSLKSLRLCISASVQQQMANMPVQCFEGHFWGQKWTFHRNIGKTQIHYQIGSTNSTARTQCKNEKGICDSVTIFKLWSISLIYCSDLKKLSDNIKSVVGYRILAFFDILNQRISLELKISTPEIMNFFQNLSIDRFWNCLLNPSDVVNVTFESLKTIEEFQFFWYFSGIHSLMFRSRAFQWYIIYYTSDIVNISKNWR